MSSVWLLDPQFTHRPCGTPRSCTQSWLKCRSHSSRTLLARRVVGEQIRGLMHRTPAAAVRHGPLSSEAHGATCFSVTGYKAHFGFEGGDQMVHFPGGDGRGVLLQVRALARHHRTIRGYLEYARAFGDLRLGSSTGGCRYPKVAHRVTPRGSVARAATE